MSDSERLARIETKLDTALDQLSKHDKIIMGTGETSGLLEQVRGARVIAFVLSGLVSLAVSVAALFTGGTK